MKVDTRELPGSQVSLTFEIDPARFERALDAASRRLATRVNIAGFRKGKAPRPLVERVVGKESLQQEALDQLLPEAFQEALQESSVRALTPPEFDVESVSPLRVTATVVVPPAVDLGDYGAIRCELPPVEVPAEKVEELLGQLREQHAQWVPTEEAAQLEDRVVMDVVGLSEGRAVLDREDTDYLIEGGSASPLPGFSEQLVGIRAGEVRAFELVVPTDDEAGDLAGKTIAFRVEAKDVKRKELPALDDVFATTVGPHAGLTELRAHLEAELLADAKGQAQREAEQKVVTEAVDGARIELPEKLVDQEIERIDERLRRYLDTLRITKEQYNRLVGKTDEEQKRDVRRQAEENLHRSFVLQAIATKEGLQVLDTEVDEGIQAAVTADGGSARSLDRALREPEVRDRLRASLLEERALKWLVESAAGQGRESSGEGER